MSEASEFEIDGVKFKLEPLKLKQQQKGLAIVVHAILPAIMAGTAEKIDVAAIVQGVERLPELFDIFAAASKVEWQGMGYVKLADFQDNVFTRRPDLFIAYVAECVATEYSAFLSANGQSVLARAAKRFESLMV